ncbi:MAG: hypothetical protein AAFO94_06850 [Bacteroidota bacterium]
MKSLLEKGEVVSKVLQLIDLKINYLLEDEDDNTSSAVTALNVMRSELNAYNALRILEIMLARDYETMTSAEIIERLAEE